MSPDLFGKRFQGPEGKGIFLQGICSICIPLPLASLGLGVLAFLLPTPQQGPGAYEEQVALINSGQVQAALVKLGGPWSVYISGS